MDPNAKDNKAMASDSQTARKENPYNVGSPVTSDLQTAWTPINQYDSSSSHKSPSGSNQNGWREINWNPPVANSLRPSPPLSPRSKRTPLPSSVPEHQTGDTEMKKGKKTMEGGPKYLSHKRKLSSSYSPANEKRLPFWKGQDHSILASSSDCKVQLGPVQSSQSGPQLESSFHCPTCLLYFSSKQQVTAHINTICSTPHTCKTCNRNFSSRSCLNRHETKCAIEMGTAINHEGQPF